MEIGIIFGLPVVLYFFFAGTAAGTFIVSAIVNLSAEKEKYYRLSFVGMILSFICISIGALFLLLDLGHPLRFWRLFWIPGLNPFSVLAWGTIIISVFFPICLLEIYLLFRRKSAPWLHYLGILFAFGLGSYTGFLIGVCKGFPLWHSAIIAPLFFVSGCMSGLSVVLLISLIFRIISPIDNIAASLRRALIYLILIDLFLLTDYYILYMGYSEAKEIALMILTGQFAGLFWIGEILLGIIFPLIILLSPFKNTKRGLSLASLLVIIGVFIMRYIIVIGGQVFPVAWKPFS